MRIFNFFTFLYSVNAQQTDTVAFRKVQRELKSQNPERWRQARYNEKQNKSLGLR